MFDTAEDIKRIVEEGDKKEMEKLSDILDEVIYAIRDYDEELYDKYARCIYIMANGDNLTYEVGKYLVENMKPFGEHWTLEQTTNVKNQYGYTDINDINFWVVMNTAYNDYYEIFKENLDVYVKWTYAFLTDIDARKNKVVKYYL